MGNVVKGVGEEGAWDVFRVLHRGINPEGGRGKGERGRDVFSES
jgi:hypothetical protein